MRGLPLLLLIAAILIGAAILVRVLDAAEWKAMQDEWMRSLRWAS